MVATIQGLTHYIVTAFPPLAYTVNGHHDWGGGWWIVMATGMFAFLALVIGGGIWLLRELGSGGRSRHGDGNDSGALEILDRRLAEGAISIEEYEERRRALEAAKGHGSG